MRVILAPSDYACWLGAEPDPRVLMWSYPAELMRIWPISTRVNKAENDCPSIVEPIELASGDGASEVRFPPKRTTFARHESFWVWTLSGDCQPLPPSWVLCLLERLTAALGVPPVNHKTNLRPPKATAVGTSRGKRKN